MTVIERTSQKMISAFLLFAASISAQCTEKDNCEQIEFPNTKDEIRVQKNSILQGHLLAEHTSPNSFDCFLRCADNCQCLSFNFKSDNPSSGTNCQLNEAAFYTNPESITQKEAWTYTEMARTYLAKPPEQSCLRDTCHNGCCRFFPCDNGGTCREVCDVRARRFACACPPGYSGHRCHTSLRSCHDILVSGSHANGIYKILNETNGTLNVYCDFHAEPGAAWALVQSHSLDKGRLNSENDIFSIKPLHYDFPVNESFPGDWSSYRLSLTDMQSIRAQSTHWRATCDFPKMGIDFRDYLRASLKNFDIMNIIKQLRCTRYEFINIRGNQCLNCTALTTRTTHWLPSIRSFQSKSYSCDFDGRPNGAVRNERNFGVYPYYNPAFRCSATDDSTTQYWFGKT